MMTGKLHPSVEEFKAFVKEHPSLIKLVRSNEYNWQELYEEWYLLGPDDPKWNPYKQGNVPRTNKSNEKDEDDKRWVQQLTGMLKKVDPHQMQHHLQNLSQAIGAIQGVLSQFQGAGQESPPQQIQTPGNPFLFRKD
ncbi:YlbD family protein [Siminovitchia sediminis]|uniref:YlbD family protein n=1 Tax=Siminovitchia sediminis TaxID=1274353 RepID=A0ABW4KEA8_9BACI